VFGDGGKDAEFIVQTLRLPRAIDWNTAPLPAR
jgi:hypothetical protein